LRGFVQAVITSINLKNTNMKTFMQNTKPHAARAMARFLKWGG